MIFASKRFSVLLNHVEKCFQYKSKLNTINSKETQINKARTKVKIQCTNSRMLTSSAACVSLCVKLNSYNMTR